MKLNIQKLLDHAEEGYQIPWRKKDGGIDLFAKSFCGDTLLHVAVGRGNLKEVKYLLEQGLDINARGDLCETPLFLAASSGNDSIVNLLLRSGADSSIPDHLGTLPKLNPRANQ